VGAVLEPVLGWRGVFVAVAALMLPVAAVLLRDRNLLGGLHARGTARDLVAVYRALLAPGRGLRTYTYVFVNAVFHSGVFTRLGVYFARRYELGEVGIGLALLGYGVSGFLLGPVIGRAADRWGRRWLLPTGLAVGAAAALLLATPVPLIAAALLVRFLSLGYDMPQPLLAGIATSLGGLRGGQAMGLNVFLLFTDFGAGSLLFGGALRWGLGRVLFLFRCAGTRRRTAGSAALPRRAAAPVLWAMSGTGSTSRANPYCTEGYTFYRAMR